VTTPDSDRVPATKQAGPPALRLEVLKGPAGWLLMTGNRAGWARLAELCRAIADSEPGSHAPGTTQPLERGQAVQELFTPGSGFQVVGCAVDEASITRRR
jgi:hypothetical protein